MALKKVIGQDSYRKMFYSLDRDFVRPIKDDPIMLVEKQNYIGEYVLASQEIVINRLMNKFSLAELRPMDKGYCLLL